MNHFPKDSTAACIAFYGDPRGMNGRASPKWEAENLVVVKFPWRATYAGKPASGARVHRKCERALAAAMVEIWEACGRDQKRLDDTGLSIYAGAYNYRVKRGLSSLSVHAFGAAIDFDPERNGLGDNTPYMPKWVVAIFQKHGATWGGDFKSRRDGMHFQFADI